MDIPTIEQTRDVTATLVKMRAEEIGYKTNAIPNRRYISDETLLWLLKKYTAIQDKIDAK